MGPDEQTTSDIEADAFFARFEHPSINLWIEVWSEQFGDLDTVVAEDKAYGYWKKQDAARAERTALRALAKTRDLQAHADRIAQLNRLDALRTGSPISRPVEHAVIVLPEPRIATLTDEERAETRRWWKRLADNQGAFTLCYRIRREIRQAREDDRFAARANAAWVKEQRACERAQWQEVRALRVDRRRRKIANQWVAISEDRALEIAIAALDKTHPPQG